MNLRKGAGTSYSVLVTIPYNKTVTVLDRSNSSWYKVEYGSYTGYVSSAWLKVTVTTTTVTATATPKPSSASTATATPSSTTTVTTVTGTITASAGLNLRKGAGTSYSVIVTIPYNKTVTVLDRSNSSWYKVKYGSYTGYVSSAWLKITVKTTTVTATATPASSSTATATPAATTVTTVTGKVTASSGLNLRKGAGTSYSVLVTIPYNKTVTVLDRSNSSWYKVKYGSYTGYVSSEWLKITVTTSTVSTATATPAATTAPSATLAPVSGQISESEAYSRLMALKEQYPDGKYWNNSGVSTSACNHSSGVKNCNQYTSIFNYLFNCSGIQCFGFAGMLSDQVFGKNAPLALHTSYDRLKVGDNIRLTGYLHSFIVLTKTDDYITVAECNADFKTCKISWGRKITRSTLESYSRIYMTRYADSKSDGTSAIGKTTTAVNLRSGAGTSYSIVTTLSSGTRVAIVNKQNKDWYYVQTLSGQSGYISASYISTVYAASTSSSSSSSTTTTTTAVSKNITITPHSDDLTIVQQYATKNDCYITNEQIQVKGLLLHSVGVSQSSAAALAETYNEYNPGGREVCPHAFLQSDGTVYQILPWNLRGWHAGGSSNATHIGVEMCEPSNIVYTGSSSFYTTNKASSVAYVQGAYNTAVELFAELCIAYDLDPQGSGVILSHTEAHELGIASNHGDPEHLWNGLGLSYTMDTFRSDVAKRVAALK